MQKLVQKIDVGEVETVLQCDSDNSSTNEYSNTTASSLNCAINTHAHSANKACI